MRNATTQERGLSVTIKLSFIMDICRGGKYLRSLRVVHRDLSARNVRAPRAAWRRTAHSKRALWSCRNADADATAHTTSRRRQQVLLDSALQCKLADFGMSEVRSAAPLP